MASGWQWGGADLAGLPAGDGDVAVGDTAEDLLDVVLRIPLLFAFEAEDVHWPGSQAASLAQGNVRQ